MSNNENNNVWEDVSPNMEFDHFGDWINLENFLKEYKQEEQFTQNTFNMMHPEIIPGEKVPVTFTSYRGDDGQLLGVHAFFTNKDGVRKPFVLVVHPDHQRQGIGTKIADFIINQYEETHKTEFDYKSIWGDVRTTESAAMFVNKRARQDLAKRNIK
jgi:GNAT superfamily N-acetyltransferase